MRPDDGPAEVEWCSAAAAAARLGVHSQTIREMARDGRLAGHKIAKGANGTWRIDVASVDALAHARGLIHPGESPEQKWGTHRQKRV